MISSPMVDLGSLVLLMSIFGAKVAAAYVILGLIIAVIGGTLIEKLHMEKYVEDFVKNARSVDISSPTLTKKDRVQYAKKQVIGTFKKVFPYILIGVGIGAVIHNWIPEKLDRECFGKSESFWCDFGNAGWNPDVCGYIRYNPCCRSFVIKRCRAGNNFIIYDGSNNIKSAVFDHAEKSCKTKNYWYYLLGYARQGLSLSVILLISSVQYLFKGERELWNYLKKRKNELKEYWKRRRRNRYG